MSDTIWLAVLGIVAMVVKEYFDDKRGRKAQAATADASGQLTSIHTLVNSSWGAQLKLTAGFARRLAEETKRASDYEAADLAEKLLREHEEKQASVDAASARRANRE